MSTGTITRFGVVGAGQMGRGIAQVAAQAQLQVVMLDANKEQAEKGLATIAQQLAGQVQKGKLTADDRDAILRRISVSDRYEDFADTQLVVEAATENFELKKKIFLELDRVLKPDAILATNTSSISITALGAATKRPEQVIGMHFMNPPPVMKLVEIIRGLPTSDATYETTRALAESFGKTTVLSRDIPGFVVNRILMPMLNEACFALYEGIADAHSIDVAINLGLAHPMGPFALMDLVGLDTTLAILEVLHKELGDDKYRPCPLLRQYVAAGWLGRKTKRGFFEYK